MTEIALIALLVMACIGGAAILWAAWSNRPQPVERKVYSYEELLEIPRFKRMDEILRQNNWRPLAAGEEAVTGEPRFFVLVHEEIREAGWWYRYEGPGKALDSMMLIIATTRFRAEIKR